MKKGILHLNDPGPPAQQVLAGQKFSDFKGVSPAIHEVRQKAWLFSRDPLGESILLTGERGTGKDVLSKKIHYNSDCVSNKSVFLECNCGSVHTELAQSTLFGHCKGSFSGAISDYPGYFRMAQDGTV